MSDRMNTRLTVGGPVPRTLVPGLCEAIREDGVSLDWDETFSPRTEADLEAALTVSRHLVLTDPEAAWGEIDHTERFCREHGIAYDRHTSARYDYDAVLVRHRPGVGTFEDASAEDGVVMHADYDVRRVRDLLHSGDVPGAVAKLDQMCPDVDGLGPLTFV